MFLPSAFGEVRDQTIHRRLRLQPGKNVHVPNNHGFGDREFRDTRHRRILTIRKRPNACPPYN